MLRLPFVWASNCSRLFSKLLVWFKLSLDMLAAIPGPAKLPQLGTKLGWIGNLAEMLHPPELVLAFPLYIKFRFSISALSLSSSSNFWYKTPTKEFLSVLT